MSILAVKVDGQLAEWLKEDGRADMIGTVQNLDAAEVGKRLIECEFLHPEYDAQTSRAWAHFSILAKNNQQSAEYLETLEVGETLKGVILSSTKTAMEQVEAKRSEAQAKRDEAQREARA